MKNRIFLKGVSVRFPDKTVFENLSLEIGENTAVMGASGSGKTTLMGAIMGRLAFEGEILFERIPEFSVVFQENRLFESFSALDNLLAVAPKEKERAKDLLSKLGIEEYDKKVSAFSGGMKRRVAIARALIFGGDILILDEAFSGLDEETKRVCAEVIKTEVKDRLILLITHDSVEAEMLEIEKIINI